MGDYSRTKLSYRKYQSPGEIGREDPLYFLQHAL